MKPVIGAPHLIKFLLCLALALEGQLALGAKFYLHPGAGLSGPGPGAGMNLGLSFNIVQNQSLGGQFYSIHNQLRTPKGHQTIQHFDGSYEYRFLFNEGYSSVITQLNLGLAYLSSYSSDRDEEKPFRPKTGLSYGGAIGLEFPFADLIGLRFLITGLQSTFKEAKPQVTLMSGFRIGSPWIGIGD